MSNKIKITIRNGKTHIDVNGETVSSCKDIGRQIEISLASKNSTVTSEEKPRDEEITIQ